MNKLYCLIVFFVCCRICNAQNFSPLAPGFNSAVRSLYFDSTTSKLYAGGNFWQLSNGETMNYISQWNGSVWDSMGFGLTGNVYSIIEYNGVLCAGGSFAIKDSSGNYILANIALWNGTSWTLPNGGGANHAVGGLMVNGGDLIVTGFFDTIGGIAANMISKYDGNNWYNYPVLDPSLGGYCLGPSIIYNGELYVGGNFNGGAGLKDIAKFDGTNWVSVAGGLSGPNTWVNCFEIFQGDLYVGGYFKTTNGDPGNNIAVWNGSSWSQPDNGVMPSNVFAMHVFHNELYVGGQINDASGLSITFIAKWDGNNWSSLGSSFDNSVTCFATHNNDLYIGGGFLTVGTDSMHFITRYSLPLTIEENSSTTNFSVFPNPVTDKLTITTHSNSLSEIILYDITSRKLLQEQCTNTLTLNTSQLSKGIYIYELRTNNGIIKKGKVVKD
jgi:hypothetical protein